MSDFVDVIDMGEQPDVQAWDGSSRPKVPPGFYDFEVAEAKIEPSKSGNNPMLNLRLKVINEGEYVGRVLRQGYTINRDQPASVGRMKNLIASLGLDWNGGKFTPQSLIGRVLNAEAYLDSFDTLDQRTGQQVSRETTKVRCESACEGIEQPEHAPVVTQPVVMKPTVATRRAASTAATGSNGQSVRR